MHFDTHASLYRYGRLAVQRNSVVHAVSSTRQGSARVALPNALPCVDFYERYPNRVGALGNVIITDEEELRPWLLVARPVPREHAETRGGCIVFAPSHGTKTNSSTALQFFCLTDPDDEVYGRAAYLPRLDDITVKSPDATLCSSENSSSNHNALTAEDSDETTLSGDLC
ncbi:hypothetical protein ABB37_09104 [Leptomonas pyrrhocoris]|uniref:Uncharacterized protein n=1 Tax=Leptomonas pyrrhocoris TaxID=157538 RepID=A0A0M9FR70_LEPPY|nr:hypothetical protein ABB37_09104 [Leptomonas pyrrhocoris]KPA74400.1 hypothetical protein ABB37_09104 [Leptomonas pyrrhocoris]|eukprot:XP_015652839.1 hypothetical protein ABB37_09104 [Leptomonas pyrrhocoris]